MQILKAVDSTSEDALQLRYFISDNGFKATVWNMNEQVLSEEFRPGWGPTVFHAEGQFFVQTSSVADALRQLVLFNAGFIVAVADVVAKRVARAADTHDLCDI